MAVRASSTPPRPPPLPGAGDVIAGKYRLERLLKQGGMGAVWVATHLGLDERVAIKFMDPRRVSSAEARMRFTREAKAAAQLRSKNIVQILDHGVDNGIPYIAMELLAGEDLGVRLRRAGKLSIVEASALLDDIAHSLDRAHAAGIVHRDLKPENIFLAKDGDREIPKILDFGIALEVQPDASDDSVVTQEGVILGTPYFMSPEQVRGRTNVDHRSDLWSVGVILFRAITGIRPFGRGGPADIIVQICSDPLPRASVVARDLPEEVDRFFEKALAREVGKRFSSAKEMAAAFAEITRVADPNERTQQDLAGPIPDRPSLRARSTLPVARKVPPLGAYQVSKTIPSPGSSPDNPAEQPGKTREVPGLAALPCSDGSNAAVAPADQAALHASAQAADTSHAGSDHDVSPTPPVGMAHGPLEDHATGAASFAAAITGTVPTTDATSAPSPTAQAISATGSSERVPARLASDTPTSTSLPSPTDAPIPGGAHRLDSARVPASGPVSARSRRSSEPRSVLWVVLGLLLGLVIAGAAFRDKLFGPPPGSKDPTGAATIVLTAGTVVLVSPGVRAPTPTAEASVTASNVPVASGSPSAAASDSASSFPAAAPARTAAESVTSPSATAAGWPALQASSTQIGKGTVPVVRPKTASTATPASTASSAGTTPSTESKKDPHDLGY